jgi:hypothetical protein
MRPMKAASIRPASHARNHLGRAYVFLEKSFRSLPSQQTGRDGAPISVEPGELGNGMDLAAQVCGGTWCVRA